MRGVAYTLAGFALIAALLGWSRWLARRRLASMGHLLMAVAAVALAALLWVLQSSLQGFEPLRPGLVVAELRIDAAHAGGFRATLTRLPEGRIQVFEIPGDRWRIEASTLEWRGLAVDLGLRPAYRLDRLDCSGPAPADAQGRPDPSYSLTDRSGADAWIRPRSERLLSRYVQVAVASTSWQPVSSGARFVLRASGQALQVERAGSEAAALAPGLR